MKLEINIEKRHFFVLLGAVLLLIAGVFVIAYNPLGVGGNPAVMGHSVDEVNWSQPIQSSINIEDVFVRARNEFVSKMVGGCDWTAWKRFEPWSNIPFMSCVSGFVTNYTENSWKTGSCTTTHNKRYTCTLNVKDTKATYDLTCKDGEDWGEWRGTERDLRAPIDHGGDDGAPGANVDYVASTGVWRLTSTGKENNHNSPLWSTKVCNAGGFAF